ncbi:hypothetical protein [Nostoc sp.]
MFTRIEDGWTSDRRSCRGRRSLLILQVNQLRVQSSKTLVI